MIPIFWIKKKLGRYVSTELTDMRTYIFQRITERTDV